MNGRLKRAITRLKNNSVRITPQRHAILEYLLETSGHPTADEIYRALEGKFPNMSVATVYNNLRVFKEAGLVRELNFGDASSRFDADMSDHYHVICNDCGKMEDFEYSLLLDMEKEAAIKTGFIVDSHRLEFYGLCPACQKRE
ncbi:peroxide-responsive transcriptional repressor PerR [Mechercharimyces sp. CAU 1602]|nr:peroxide-responsive transcriptional repressor PerR [Mechercharimyces sp. CAU 1602]